MSNGNLYIFSVHVLKEKYIWYTLNVINSLYLHLHDLKYIIISSEDMCPKLNMQILMHFFLSHVNK